MKNYTLQYCITDLDGTNLEELYEVYDEDDQFIGYVPYHDHEEDITEEHIKNHLNL